MSVVEKQKWPDFDLDSDSNISTKLQKAEDDDKGSCGYQQLALLERFNTSFSQRKLNPERERHAELFRKDLISAMKLADSEMLQPEEYFQITDQWKQEWERGVQVPINPGAIIPNVVRVISENESLYGPPSFKLPKKFLHATQDEAFKPAIHELHEGQKLTEEVCRYDLDDLDILWLQTFNEICEEIGKDPVTELQVEKVIEELETHCHTKLQQAEKTVEGLGIEYDENVVCDVCRSPEGEDNNEMVFCDSCDVCIHQACYGIQMIPEGNWLCRACALGIKPQCVLCPNSGGAMKSTKNGNEWAHISCALWIPEVHIGCPEKMEPINNITQIPGSRWSLVCTLCRERQGACIQCSVKSCKTSFHVTCAFQNNLEMHQTYDETIEDVQMKAFCPKHSGQKTSDNVNEDGMPLSPKPQGKSELTEEEKTELRSHRLKKLEEEFYLYISPKEVAEALGIDETIIDFIYNYWVIKRKSQSNRPLLMPKLEEGDILLKQREDGLLARLKMFINLRQELERVRNLCYMVCKREKLNRQMYRSKEEIFSHMSKITDDSDCEVDASLLNALHATNTIYDHPEGILRAARLLEQRERALDMQESQGMLAEKVTDGEAVKHQTEADVEIPPSLHPVRLEFSYKKDDFCAADNKTNIRSFSGLASELYSDQPRELYEVENKCIESDDFVISKWGKRNFLDIEETNKSMNGFCSEDENKPLAELALDSPTEETPNNIMTPDLPTTNSLILTSDVSTELENRLPSELSDSKCDIATDESHLNTNLNLTATDTFVERTNHSGDPVRTISESSGDKDNVLKENGLLNGDSFAFVNKSIRHRDHKKSDNEAIEHEACNSTNQLPEIAPPTLTSMKSAKRAEAVHMRRKQTGVTSRRSKRCKVADENLEKKDSVTISCPSNIFADQQTADDSVSKSVNEPEATDPASELNFVNDHFNQSLSHASVQNASLRKDDNENGWSSIKHKLPLNNKPSCMTAILKRFSPAQLVVSKEIKQKVERCLLKLPYLKSSNGMLCKHLQQKLTSCNLNYVKQTVRPTKSYDRNSKDHLEQSANHQITSSVDSSNTHCTWHKDHYRVENSSQKVKDCDEFKLESDEIEDLNFSKTKRQKLCRRRSSFKGFKYELDTSDCSQTVRDNDFVLSDSSSGECSQSGAGDSYGSEQDNFADGGSSNSIVKELWASKFKR